MLSAQDDSSVRTRRIFFPGQVVEIATGALEGLGGSVVEHTEQGFVVFKVACGVYLRVNERKLRKIRQS